MATSDALCSGAHAFTTASGATLTYFVNGSGPRLLVNVAPGWGPASVLYQNTFDFLEPHFTLVHLEVRGTRGSTFPANLSEMSSWHMAEDVESLRVHLGLDALDGVLGHSNGGCIATWFAARFPARLKKLILVDSQLLGIEFISTPATLAVIAARPDGDVVEAWQRWRASASTIDTDEKFGSALSAYLALYVAQPEKHLASVRAAFTNLPQIRCRKAQAAAEPGHSNQLPELTKITVPTLVIVGRDDFVCPVPVSEMIAAGLSNSRLHILDDCGHFPWIEKEAEFIRLLNDFYTQE